MRAKITVNSPLNVIEAANKRAMDRLAKKHRHELIMVDATLDMAAFSDHIPGKRMLDAGCGTARDAALFVEAGLKYLGIDISPEMLKLAREVNPKLRFEQMSFRTLRFADGSFHGLWSCCALCHEPKRNVPTVLAEWRRVLVDGGLLYLVLPDYEASAEDVTPHQWFEAFWELREITKVLAAAGFETSYSDRNDDTGVMYLMSRKK